MREAKIEVTIREDDSGDLTASMTTAEENRDWALQTFAVVIEGWAAGLADTKIDGKLL